MRISLASFLVVLVVSLAAGCTAKSSAISEGQSSTGDDSARHESYAAALELVSGLRTVSAELRASLLEANLVGELTATKTRSGARVLHRSLVSGQSSTVSVSYLKGLLGNTETLRRLQLEFPDGPRETGCLELDDASERLGLSVQPPQPTGYGGTQWRREAVARTARNDVYVSTNDVRTPCVVSIVVDFKD